MGSKFSNFFFLLNKKFKSNSLPFEVAFGESSLLEAIYLPCLCKQANKALLMLLGILHVQSG